MEEDIEGAIERLSKAQYDIWYATLYSQEEQDEDIKLLLKHYKNLHLAYELYKSKYEKLEKENKTSKETINILTNKLEKVVEENEELKTNYINPSKARISYYDTKKGTEVVIEGFIPISVIQNTLDNIDRELEEKYSAEKISVFSGNTYMEKFKLLGSRQVLQELLEERNK